MAESIRINTEEYNEEFSRKLKVGDSVLITGKIYSARDAAHKVMTEALARGEKLPIDWTNKFVYYLGPTPAKPGDPIGSAGPTTSGRMDAYTPTMLDQGIKGMIGKGSRKPAVVESMKKNGCTYFAAVGGARLAGYATCRARFGARAGRADPREPVGSGPPRTVCRRARHPPGQPGCVGHPGYGDRYLGRHRPRLRGFPGAGNRTGRGRARAGAERPQCRLCRA